MKHNLKFVCFLLIGGFLATVSCQKDDDALENSNQYNIPSIETAKAYFNDNINLSSLGSSSLRNGESLLNSDWDLSKAKKYKDEPQESLDILYTPIYLPTAGKAKSFVGSVEVNNEMQSKLFILLYKQAENSGAFSGFMMIYNLDGQIEYSYEYTDGQRVAEGLPSLVNSTLNRTNDGDCESPFDSIGCLIDWVGGDWFGINGFIENDLVEIIAVGDSNTGGGPFDDSSFGNPGFSIPALDDSTAGANGNIEEPWWLDNTVSANALSIIMALELEHVALPEADWLLNQASQEQLTSIANFLNANRSKDKNTSPDGIENDGLNPNQMTEISQEALDFAISMINFLMNNPSISFEHNSSNDINTNTLNFGSFDEFEDYYDNLNGNSYTTMSSTFQDGSIRRDVHSLEFNSFPQADLVTTVKIAIPNNNNTLENLNVINARTILEGNNTFFDWTQLDSEDPDDSDGILVEINEDLNRVKISIEGEMLVGLNISNYPIRFRHLITVVITYDYSTAEINENYCYWHNTNN
ncbi:hypothetical protein [uncultured Psychroserpens sp.]|uniref:hypothetical protein n=1 Tax=uncultured Psychroserpens sp. TaxID=255436 RepID=UPI002624C03A|nr:hypothetical protein [uncultured Psychroserpens sp.]